jgi:hypothetical protein
MGHTYHKVYLQFVFAVKYRNAVLDKKWHKLQTCASKGVNQKSINNENDRKNFLQ